MSGTTISVVIPACNSEETLPTTLRSVLDQTRVPAQIVVVDDGSRLPVSNLLGSRFPRVEVARHSVNGGVQAARGTGFSKVCSDYVLFLDSDDVLCPEYLETAAGLLDADREAGACFCGFYKAFGMEEVEATLAAHVPQPAVVHKLAVGKGMSFYLEHTGSFLPSFALFRRSALVATSRGRDLFFNGVENLAPNEDFHLFVRFLSEHPVLRIKNPLGVYFLRPQSASRNLVKSWRARRAALESLLRLAGEYPFSREQLAQFREMRGSAARKVARILARQGNRREAIAELIGEARDAPSLKTSVQLLALVTGLDRRKIRYGDVEL